MQIRIQIDNSASSRLRQLADSELPGSRRALVEAAMKSALQQTIQRNPVDTARSRSAWVTSLEQLGGTPPAGWQGSTPSAVSEGRGLGALTQQHEGDISQIEAVNHVNYVRYLEYGTSRRSPVAMVRVALSRVLPHIASWFRLS